MRSSADFSPMNDEPMLGDEEGSGSGFMMIGDDTHMDDEDYTPQAHAPAMSQHVIRVNFECQYSTQPCDLVSVEKIVIYTR